LCSRSAPDAIATGELDRYHPAADTIAHVNRAAAATSTATAFMGSPDPYRMAIADLAASAETAPAAPTS
jgi:hypothetical protein